MRSLTVMLVQTMIGPQVEDGDLEMDIREFSVYMTWAPVFVKVSSCTEDLVMITSQAVLVFLFWIASVDVEQAQRERNESQHNLLDDKARSDAVPSSGAPSVRP